MHTRRAFWSLALFAAAFTAGGPGHAEVAVAITPVAGDPLVAFAAGDIERALVKVGHTVGATGAHKKIIFEIYRPGIGPQGFRIRTEGADVIRIVGGDSCGAMYGGLELAEMIVLGGGLDAVEEKARKPYVFRRGLKFNIPLDARAPSYDDTGDAARRNIPVMWEWSFWEQFLDTMARNRYNVLSLWTTHPYPALVRLKKYPGVSYDDVCVLKKAVDLRSDRHFEATDLLDSNNLRVVKRMPLDDKIAFWRKVFAHAEDRGIEIYIFHWNIYTFGAKGKHGIDDRPDNPRTIAYMRYAISEFLRTYPQVDGIGVTAGEHVDRDGLEDYGIEEWLWRTYGQGVMDVKRENPKRELRFIFRQHQAKLGRIVDAFKDFDGPFHTGHKYARARIYSTTTSPYLDFEYREDLERHRVPCWLNLRNDDIFVHRWGDAEHVREFLRNIPRDLMQWEAGFYMGPDGYVWGREFISKDPALSGELEVHKHWYRFMLWGRLGYDLTLTRDYFHRRLKQRFPDVDPGSLLDTWAAASRIIPLVNQFFFRVNDLQFSPEGCMSKEGFLTVEAFFEHPPLRGSGILSVKEYAEAVVGGGEFTGITPMEVGERLDGLAARALEGVGAMRGTATPGRELSATLGDIESMAYLGRYYADKIRAAAALAVFRRDPARKDHHERAVGHLESAAREWEAYARVATRQYRPQLFSRTHYMDWWQRLEDVKSEIGTIK